MGAALTYARRYALFTLVGIAGEDDLDAPDLNAPTGQAPETEKPHTEPERTDERARRVRDHDAGPSQRQKPHQSSQEQPWSQKVRSAARSASGGIGSPRLT